MVRTAGFPITAVLGFLLAPVLAGISPAAAQPVAPINCNLAAADASQAGAGCATAWFDANLRINEIQTAGSAESYKQRPSSTMLTLIRMGSDADAKALDFEEPPIPEQLDAGARSLAFDVAYDPKGGLFKSPAGASMADELLADDYLTAMSAPGFKVIHVLDIDFHSSCTTLVACLQQVATWSRANPSHVPIVISLQTNDARTPMPGATHPIAFDAAAFDALDAEILSVFKPGEIITPDVVQGSFATLREATAAHNWPMLGPSRGKVLFVLDDAAPKVALYRGSRATLEGRVMFVNTDANSPAAAFVTIENATKSAAEITADVKAGLMVHTYADADTIEARKASTARADAAFAAGAQIVSSDFFLPDKSIGPYQVRISNGGHAQCDVQLSPMRCAGLDVELGKHALAD
jgi:hypothetical protein